jgi:hypothetical protein
LSERGGGGLSGEAAWLSKGEVNARYYSEVGGEIVFATEAQRGYHPVAVARLVAAQARRLGKDELRILELGANNGAFAGVLLQLLGELREEGAPLRKVDYFAAEQSRAALEAALAANEQSGRFENVRRLQPAAGGSSLVGVLGSGAWTDATLYLLHAEANECLRRSSGSFDVVIANELLDDLPCRAFFADAEGSQRELTVQTRQNGDGWIVRVGAERIDEPLTKLPPRTLTATSDAWRSLARGAASALPSGGLLLVHDYGFADPYASLDQYEAPPRSVPPFVKLEFPRDAGAGFPRSFYRVFGNEAKQLIQITTDVNFAEVAAELAPSGTTIVLPHGNAIVSARGRLEPDDGVFLSEFALLDDGADLSATFARLDASQAELRERYADAYLGGSTAVFSDLVFLKR